MSHKLPFVMEELTANDLAKLVYGQEKSTPKLYPELTHHIALTDRGTVLLYAKRKK